MIHSLSKFIQHNYQHRPLAFLMGIALILKLLAAIYSQGYAFSDDHFTVITPAQAWLNGATDYWLDDEQPPKHSLLYTSIHYLAFAVFESIGITAPQSKMLLMRLLHALYSLLIVYLSYQITLLISNKRAAFLVGLMLSVLWFMPFMSVRNLVEMVCIPPTLAGLFLTLKGVQQTKWQRKYWLWAGVFLGLAFCIRFQTMLFAVGIGMVLLYFRSWQSIIWLSIGYLLSSFVFMASFDVYFFDYPFQSVVNYIGYNSTHSGEYPNGPFYQYIFTILGFLVPPISLFLLAGVGKSARQQPILFWSMMAFFLFHSFFPNKQERFIIPMLPLVVILGIIGWEMLVVQYNLWKNHPRLLIGMWKTAIVINILALLLTTFTYTKKTRVATLSYLSEKTDIQGIVLESDKSSLHLPPLFYLNKKNVLSYDRLSTNQPNLSTALPQEAIITYSLPRTKSLDSLQLEIQKSNGISPNYIILYGKKNKSDRLTRLQKLFPNLQLEKSISASWYDAILHFLNPRHNRDESCQIYRIESSS